MFKKIMMVFASLILSLVFISCNQTTTTKNDTTQDTTADTILEPTTITYDTELLVDNNSVFQAPTVDSGYLVSDVQDGVILHAWNWSMTTIEENLEDIAIAGYSTIQISPMQPQKDYYGVASWGSSWWKFYQPLGLSIATENHALGTKDELISLCSAADAYGIKIIVDVVANHLAGGDNETLNEDVLGYEAEIYNQSLVHTAGGYVSDNKLKLLVTGAMGQFPDLQTENQIVQDAVLDLLKEYVDCGIDGFRFDAAKHIETPEDGDYASDFWPTVINGVSSYAESLGREALYFYGEILNTVGTGREYTDYTQYMAVTDSSMSDGILTAVRADKATRLDYVDYITGLSGSDVVLWAESHDTYASGSSDDFYTKDIIKTYAIEASRSDSTALFFVRPDDTTLIGECGTYFWQSAAVTEVNRFSNYFVGTDEAINTANNFFMNERYGEEIAGAVIIDFAGQGSVSGLTSTHLPVGAYVDQITGNIFVVTEDGTVHGTVGNTGIAVIYNNEYKPLPSITISNDGTHGTFTDTLEVEFSNHNTTEAYFSLNGEDFVEFDGEIDLELSHPDLNAVVTLEFELYYGDYKIVKSFEYIKSNIVVEEVIVYNIDQSVIQSDKIVAWTWKGTGQGTWVEGVYDNGLFSFDLPVGNDRFLLVLFPEGTSVFDWPNRLKQTNDCEVSADGAFDGSTLVWA